MGIATIIQEKVDDAWLDVGPPEVLDGSISLSDETRRTLRLEFRSGDYSIFQGEEIEIWFAEIGSII